jgi:hypothetical protein
MHHAQEMGESAPCQQLLTRTVQTEGAMSDQGGLHFSYVLRHRSGKGSDVVGNLFKHNPKSWIVTCFS